MAAEPYDVDVDAMTAEEFVALVRDHFAPDRAGGTTGRVQMRITDDGEPHPYVIELEGEPCSTRRGTADDPRTTITTDLVRFTRIAVGQADGVKLLLRRKLKASGDVSLARRIPGFFDIPEP